MIKEQNKYKYGDLLGSAGLMYIAPSLKSNNKHPRAWFKCFCNKEFEAVLSHVKFSNKPHCGAHSLEKTNELKTIEAQLMSRYHLIKDRCYNKSNKRYARYGGRGITVSQNWLDDPAVFISDMSEGFESHLQIDRIDNDLGYSKENCRWVTSKQNSRNKGNTLKIKYNGEERLLIELAEEKGLNPKLIRERLARGDKGDKIFRPPWYSSPRVSKQTIKVWFEGEERLLADLAKERGISYSLCRDRLKKGVLIENLFKPSRNRNPRKSNNQLTK